MFVKGKYYQSIVTKTIKCIEPNCGKEFEVDAISRRIRCNDCYKKERQRIEKEKKRKQRLSH